MDVFFSACLTLRNLWICCYMRDLAPYPMTQVLPNLHRFALYESTISTEQSLNTGLFNFFSVQRIFFRCGSDRPKSVTPKDIDFSFQWFWDFLNWFETRPMCPCFFFQILLLVRVPRVLVIPLLVTQFNWLSQTMLFFIMLCHWSLFLL